MHFCTVQFESGVISDHLYAFLRRTIWIWCRFYAFLHRLVWIWGHFYTFLPKQRLRAKTVRVFTMFWESTFATPARDVNISLQLVQKHVFSRCLFLEWSPLSNETLTFRSKIDPNRPQFDPKWPQMAPSLLGASCFTVDYWCHLHHSRTE